MVPEKSGRDTKRRRYFINRGFQTRFAAVFLSILILGGCITVGLTLFNTQGSLTSTYAGSKLVIQDTSLAIMPSVVVTTVLTTLVIGFAACLVLILVSHKIAGPIYRFEKDISKVARGDLTTRISIREKDQFQELAVSLNRMIRDLALKVGRVKEQAQALSGRTDAADRIREKIDDHFRL